MRFDKLFNIYLSLLVRLEGKHDFEGNRDFQTLNLGFPGHFDRFECSKNNVSSAGK